MRSLLLLLLGLLPFALSAQLGKGTTTLGGSAIVNANIYEGDTHIGTGLAPEFGLFLSDHFLLGSAVSEDDISPFARYYFNPRSESTTHWFTGLHLNYNWETLSRFSATYQVGLSQFIAPTLALEVIPFLRANRWERGRWQWQSGINLGLRTFFSADQRREWKSAAAAFGQSSLMLGINTAFFEYTFGQRPFFQLSIAPNIGYFVSNRLALGANLNAFFFRENQNDYTGHGLNIGPFARYYLSSGRQLCWFVDGGYSWYGYQTKYEGQSRNTYSNHGFNAGLGANVFLSPNVALEAKLGLGQNLKEKVTDVGLSVGFKYFLNNN